MTDDIKREELGLPWRLDAEDEVILTEDGFCATVLSKGKTGQYIVTAANAHHELVKAAKGVEELFARDDECSIEHFDRKAMLFYGETGIWPPGKSAPDHVETQEDAMERFSAWQRGKVDALRAALASAEGGA